jgi:3-hydroxymyristoyl/3-hydroxydecanoyl-(acyl carrier protein) dehydratase
LQPCGFLSAYKGSFLLFPGTDLYFRNLDGQANLLRDIDLRGKTVTTQALLLSTAIFEGTIIQRFEFECSCEGQVFYRGSSAFGFFTREAMLKQVGLDSGKAVLPWLEQTGQTGVHLDLTSPAGRARFYRPPSPDRPYYRLSGGRLDLLDEVVLRPGEGRFGQGYIYATRQINPADWFYKCHFYQDAVMPGSLGIEAIFQAMQVFAIEQDLGRHLQSPRFGQLFDHNLAWKYRGQITPDNRQMALEIHLNRLEIEKNRVILTGEASLWKDRLRIYEIKQVGLALYEAAN